MSALLEYKTASYKSAQASIIVSMKLLNNSLVEEEPIKQLSKARSNAEFLNVFKEYPWWFINNKVLTNDDLKTFFTIDELKECFIFTSGEHSIQLTGEMIEKIITLDSSQATVKTLDSSQATVKTWDSSQATVETWGSSQATVETWGSSQATVETLGSSQATVETLGSSQATVKTWDSSQATVETLDSSQIKSDASKGGLIQDRTNKKLFIKKSDYEIILLD